MKDYIAIIYCEDINGRKKYHNVSPNEDDIKREKKVIDLIRR